MKTFAAIGLIVVGTAVYAQQSSEPVADPAKPKAATPDNAATPPDGNSSPDIFIPTEKISEDFAVPFPVDI